MAVVLAGGHAALLAEDMGQVALVVEAAAVRHFGEGKFFALHTLIQVFRGLVKIRDKERIGPPDKVNATIGRLNATSP